MISLTDLKKRVYFERDCVEFTYYLSVNDDNAVELKYSKVDDDLWGVFVVIRLDNSFTRVIYDGVIKLPSKSMKLESVCAFGLTCFLRACNDMSGMFSQIAYAASETVKDM